MANGNDAKLGNGGGDWKVWAIRLGFGIIAAMLPITLALAALSYSSMKESFAKDVTRIELAVQLYSTEHGKKIDQLCQKVQDHDTWLRMPFNQRKELFMYSTKHTEMVK